MGERYTTIFEVSWRESLLHPLLFFAIGVIALLVITRKNASNPSAGFQKGFLYFFWAPLWFGISLLWLFSAVHDGYQFTRALRSGQCAIVEGTVSVLHEQPRSGHAAGDRIRIADKEFVYSYFRENVGYHQTVSRGGALMNGVSARLYYVGGTILKVEIKK